MTHECAVGLFAESETVINNLWNSYPCWKRSLARVADTIPDTRLQIVTGRGARWLVAGRRDALLRAARSLNLATGASRYVRVSPRRDVARHVYELARRELGCGAERVDEQASWRAIRFEECSCPTEELRDTIEHVLLDKFADEALAQKLRNFAGLSLPCARGWLMLSDRAWGEAFYW